METNQNNIKRRLILLVLLLSLAPPAGAETTGRGGLFFGSKSLDHDDWGDFDRQAAWGFNLDVKDTEWPVWITGAYISSKDEDTIAGRDLEAKTMEYHLGLKKDFYPVPKVRLSAGAGPAYIRASLDNTAAPFNGDSDGGAGAWAGADAIVFLGVIALGVGYQYSTADVDLLGRSVDAGGSNVSFTFGVGW